MCYWKWWVVGLMMVMGVTSIQARTLEDIQKNGSIVIASEGVFPPFNYFKGSQLTGFEVDLAAAMAKKMNLKVKWKILSFDSLLTGLQQNRWDAVFSGVTITPARERAVTFINPYACSGAVVVSKTAKIRTAANLAGKNVSVLTGSTYLPIVQAIPGIQNVKNFPRDSDARSTLIAGRVDAWVTDRFVAFAAMQADPKQALVMGDMLSTDRLAGVVKKGNIALAQALNKALDEVIAEGTFKELSEKYFHEDIRCH